MPLVEDTRDPRGPVSAKVDPGVDKATGDAYWRRTSSLMWIMMAIWAIAGFGVHLFATSLNTIVILGFPLGFYMAAQGSLIIFVVSLFWFASRQNAIDEEFGVEEE